MSVTLHPTKGVNPRLSVCEWCGADVGVILLGAHDHMTHCRPCGITLVGGGRCPKCKAYGTDREPIPEHAKLPGGLCDACQTCKADSDAAVAAGGVYWRCVDCKSQGAIKASAPLAGEVRAQLKVPTGPCGVEFTKAECPACGKERS